MSKFYAVRKGRKPGIYNTWPECNEQVKGYKGAEYKSFTDEYDAVDYVNKEKENITPEDIRKTGRPYAFVDGSFNESKGIYGFGGFLVAKDTKIILQGNGTDPEMACMRNVAGEILGATEAIKKAIELNLSELIIFYDYTGIEQWAIGNWETNKKGTQMYKAYCESVADKINLIFVHVKGHTGVIGNEEADRLAKNSVGL